VNFLDLAQDLRQETGITGNDGTPVSCQNQAGEMKRVVDWITKANEKVQNKHENWDFLRDDFTFPTLIGQNTYLPTGVSLTTLNRWKIDTLRCYLTAAGTSDEMRMYFVDYDDFRDLYLFSANRTVPGRPVKFTVRPKDKAIITWPSADQPYTISGEYWKSAQAMTKDADVPAFPSQFHRILVFRGMMFYGAFEAAPEVYAAGESEFNRLMGELEADQLPPIGTAGAMA
jgi:hypothetical protein